MRLPMTCLLLAMLLSSSGLSQDMPPAQRAAGEADKIEPEVRRLALELWHYSETALREHRSPVGWVRDPPPAELYRLNEQYFAWQKRRWVEDPAYRA